ncbi:CO dehydrogenase/acetyl-CoA synthase complex subunit epsilon [Methanocella conradii]|uniref:CO dehydrogenase/acetyl-CoA synthase complex subunit epsilon n=1 Tax=Methanocella conradii TaxID=1175444 RepID=UPI00157C958B|nr:CO dehydrogenase/acetyl-CoA synthase complex subunit epsilon [Methanocella conradii]
MVIIEPWQIAEISGPKKAAVISKPEVIDAMIKRSKHPIMVVGHLAAKTVINDKKMIDYLIDLGNKRNIPIIATGGTNRELLDRGYTQATIMPAVDAGQRLSDHAWKGLDGKGPYDLVIFAGLPYYMEWTILSNLKHFASHVKTISLDTVYQPNASFSFSNISTKEWLESLNAIIGHKEG